MDTKLGGTETWWEPVIGARGTSELSERWSAALMADFGGCNNIVKSTLTMGAPAKTNGIT